MTSEERAAPDFGNWVSPTLIFVPLAVALFFIITAFFVTFFFLVIAALFIVTFIYFWYAYHKFSVRGGNVQDSLRSLVVDHLKWDGRGKAIDIGCGNGALAIKVAQKYPGASVTGIDYWGKEWGYSAKACGYNAAAAGVADRVSFTRASAVKLPFDDGYFDSAVSNLVFHEVHDARNKKDVVRETMRVVKKGGCFSFQDLFLLRNVYGDINRFLEEIRGWGISEVYFIDTSKSGFIPKALKAPFMIGKIGVIYGRK
jgi:ubiquinone/menaquinone biosynthesis C-methylase UbiE